jgi:hypothetical protein
MVDEVRETLIEKGIALNDQCAHTASGLWMRP